MENIRVNISHLDEDALTNEKIKGKFSDLFLKMQQIDENLDSIDVDIEAHHTDGEKRKYSIKSKMNTPKGMFLAHKWGWNILGVVEDTVKALEKEMKNKYEKDRDITRKAKFLKKQ